MYVVMSKWEFDPKNELAVKALARTMMERIKGWAGVERAYNVRVADNAVVAIMCYTDESSYQRLIQDPSGPFETALRETGFEEHAKWVWSERGYTE